MSPLGGGTLGSDLLGGGLPGDPTDEEVATMALSSGRLRQAYVKDESTYGTPPTLASTDALRVTNLTLPYNAQNLRKSTDRHAHPSLLAMFRGRRTAAFDLTAKLYPSGVLNTLPEINTILKDAMGQAASNITLSTTFSGTPTTTTGTVASATGLAAGQGVQITIAAGAFAGVYIRWLTSATSGTALVWSPALPAAPVSGDACKGCVTYLPATAQVPTSFDIAYYDANFVNREMPGCVADKVSIMFDSNLETLIKVSGLGARLVDSPQSQPVAFTTVGAEKDIPSGLTGYFQYGGTLYQIEKMTVDWSNGFNVYNNALGTAFGTSAYRKGVREVTLKVSAKVSTDLTLWTPSLTPGPAAPTENTVMLQIGVTSAFLLGVFFPRVVFNKTPDNGDNDEENDFNFEMTALGVNGNDELAITFA